MANEFTVGAWVTDTSMLVLDLVMVSGMQYVVTS